MLTAASITNKAKTKKSDSTILQKSAGKVLTNHLFLPSAPALKSLYGLKTGHVLDLLTVYGT